MKKVSTWLTFLVLAVACTARNPGNEAHRSSSKLVPDSAVVRATDAGTGSGYTEEQSFKAGGTSIIIPPPAADFVEVGYDKRGVMETFVPQNNRLLCAFLLTDDLPSFGNGPDLPVMAKYAMVEVYRQTEWMDCEASYFKEVTDAAKKTFGDMPHILGDVEREFNRRMKSLNLDEQQVSIGHQTQLGCFFSKQDAYGYGMIAAVSVGGVSRKKAVGGALLRVKKRLLLLYLHADYENEGTIKWLRTATEEWADAILRANT